MKTLLIISLLFAGCATNPRVEMRDASEPHNRPYCENRTIYYGDAGGWIYIWCVHEFLEENPQFLETDGRLIGMSDTPEARAAWDKWTIRNVGKITKGRFQPK